MKKYFYIFIIGLLIISSSCEFVLEEVPVPEFKNSELKGAKPLPDNTKQNIDGVYLCTSQDKPFGDTIVIKTSGDYFSVFTGKNTTYMVMSSGSKANDIILEGYWRHANSDMTGIIRFKILATDGGRELLSGSIPSMIKVSGQFDGADGTNLKDINFVRVDSLRNIKKDFYIIAHKGGGRNIDRLPHSENSIELIEYAERLGANSIEIDVRLTKDNIPVLFHDDRLSSRTVNNKYLIGAISEYSYKQLEAIAPLKQGEKIPSLDDALAAVVNNTNLKLVWLDIKNADVVHFIQPIQKKYNDMAAQKERHLEILIGIPDAKVYDKIITIPYYNNVPTLCELDENYVVGANSRVWAPRWSMGLLNDRIKIMHEKRKRVFVWTLDDPELIKTYIRKSDFDGIVTNYSPFVAYEYYMGKR